MTSSPSDNPVEALFRDADLVDAGSSFLAGPSLPRDWDAAETMGQPEDSLTRSRLLPLDPERGVELSHYDREIEYVPDDETPTDSREAPVVRYKAIIQESEPLPSPPATSGNYYRFRYAFQEARFDPVGERYVLLTVNPRKSSNIAGTDQFWAPALNDAEAANDNSLTTSLRNPVPNGQVVTIEEQVIGGQLLRTFGRQTLLKSFSAQITSITVHPSAVNRYRYDWLEVVHSGFNDQFVPKPGGGLFGGVSSGTYAINRLEAHHSGSGYVNTGTSLDGTGCPDTGQQGTETLPGYTLTMLPVMIGAIVDMRVELDANAQEYYVFDANNAFCPLCVDESTGTDVGACCFSSGICQQLTATACTGQGGTFVGGDCNPCTQPAPFGACCFANGQCILRTEAACTNEGGTYQGDSTVCSPVNPCPQPPDPTGACCTAVGDCFPDTTQVQCETGLGGQWQGAQTSCNPNPCPPVIDIGACCLSQGGCIDTTQGSCNTQGGQWLGAGTSCFPSAPCDFNP